MSNHDVLIYLSSPDLHVGTLTSALESLDLLVLQGESLPRAVFTVPSLRRLQSLRLVGSMDEDEDEEEADDVAVRYIRPNLLRLSMWYSMVGQSFVDMLGELPSLAELKLMRGAYDGEQLVFQDGRFPGLHTLGLGLPELEEWTVRAGSMAALVTLTLFRCANVEMLPEALAGMKELEEVVLFKMPKMVGRNEEGGEDHHKIKHVRVVQTIRPPPSLPPTTVTLPQSEMANFPVDPSQFIPGQFEIVEVANRPQQCRYHVSRPVSAKHEDVAIATIDPAFPGDQPFAMTRMFLRSFIEEEMAFTLDMTQRCPIGSAYIRVNSPADRDWLVSCSPHQFLGKSISFVEHNRGIDHRAFTYNRECWLMLLAFPSDYWDDDHIRGAVKDFGALISWDKEASSYGALIAKNLGLYQSTFLVRNCWEVYQLMKMCLLLMAPLPTPCPMLPFRVLPQLLMVLPQFTMILLIGLFWQHMQPGPHGPVQAPPVNLAGQNLQVIFGNQGFDLNDVPPNAALDLNEPHQLHDDDFLELNDLLNPVFQNNGPPHVIMALPVPEKHMAEDVDMLPNEDNQSDLTVTISSVHASSDESGGSVNGGLGNQNLHIGMVLMPEFQVDPVAALSPAYASTSVGTSLSAAHVSQTEDFIFSKEGTSAWSTYFKPDGSIINTVKILSDFEAQDDSLARAFVLPRDCPSEAPPVCTLTLACEKITQGFMTPQALKNQIVVPSHSSTLTLHLQKRSKKTPTVCSEVRRSNMIKALNKGYKAKTCFDRNCLACAAIGPGIKKSVVTNLCARFNIPEELEEEEDADEEEPSAVVPTDKKQKPSSKKCNNAVTKKTPKKK
ncbi:hypothetical protein ACQ4PT_000444 [Festuca glaucescens]